MHTHSKSEFGPIVHVIKRGARGMEIVRDKQDRDRFVDTLFFLNDKYKNENWISQTVDLPRFTRPSHWPKHNPLVNVLGWTLLDNHLHLLIQTLEGRENGLPEFAQRIFRSMTGHFNEKYSERGSIFQGPYKAVTIDSDEYLRYVIPYVMVKNTMEMHPKGLNFAAQNFENAWQWAINFPYSSLRNYIQKREPGSRILAEDNIIRDIFPTESAFKNAARDMLSAYIERREELLLIQLED